MTMPQNRNNTHWLFFVAVLTDKVQLTGGCVEGMRQCSLLSEIGQEARGGHRSHCVFCWPTSKPQLQEKDTIFV